MGFYKERDQINKCEDLWKYSLEYSAEAVKLWKDIWPFVAKFKSKNNKWDQTSVLVVERDQRFPKKTWKISTKFTNTPLSY